MLRSNLPQWVKDNILQKCTYCDFPILDNSDTGVMTARKCSNPKCPGHMSFKADYLAKFFHIKGFGDKTALNVIKVKKFESHFDFIPYWFEDKKPWVSLAEMADLACIEGYGLTQAQNELNSYRSFTDYFNTCTMQNPLLAANREMLLRAEKYFDFKPPMSDNKLYVMATGSFHGFENRGDFFNRLNLLYGSAINIIQTGKRKTGVAYLIKEVDAVDHSKSQIAKECGIPIVTPNEFCAILHYNFPYILEDALKLKENSEISSEN